MLMLVWPKGWERFQVINKYRIMSKLQKVASYLEVKYASEAVVEKAKAMISPLTGEDFDDMVAAVGSYQDGPDAITYFDRDWETYLTSR